MKPLPPPPATGRIQEFDALRGLAALAVVLFHFTARYDALFGWPQGAPFQFSRGDYGVDLFFMLSGFVIFMTLGRTARPADFAWGRFSRLYPAYWAALGVTFAVVALSGLPGQEVSTVEALANTTMVQALIGARHVDGAYWSLQVELFFYAGVATLYYLGAFRRLRVALALWLLAAVVVQGVLGAVGDELPAVAKVMTKLQTLFSLKYIHLFVLGMVFYEVHQARRVKVGDGLLIAACLAVQAGTDSLFGVLLVAGFCGLFGLIITGHLHVLRARPLLWLGSISYPLYLLHQNVGYVVIRALNGLGAPGLASLAAAGALVLLLAVAVSMLVERPALAWLRARFARRKQERTPLVLAGEAR